MNRKIETQNWNNIEIRKKKLNWHLRNIILYGIESVRFATQINQRKEKKTPPANWISVKMDFDSPDPDVEKEFPGLFASESAANRKKDDDDCIHFFFFLNLI